jgi:hypothetical protein
MTDYDDFKKFGGGSVVAAYGMPAAPHSPRSGMLPGLPTGPATPDDASTVRRSIEQRIAWLKNELRMHASWVSELSTLERALDAMKGPPEAERTDR